MNSISRKFTALSIASATLLSIPFLVPHCGAFALCALVPLLWMDKIADESGVRGFWKWHYLTFVLWNAFTTFWVCNATVAGGIFAVLANAAQMSVLWAVFRLSKKKFSGMLPYVFLAAMWIAWERFYFDAEISWPWLVLGNAFATTTTAVQWYEITGLLGGSLWIWACNLTIFAICVIAQKSSWKTLNTPSRIAISVLSCILFIVPPVASAIRYHSYMEEHSMGYTRAVVLQPDFDPYEKFESLTQDQQNDILISLIDNNMPENPAQTVLFIAPETFTSDVTLNYLEEGATLNTLKYAIAGHEGTSVLFGASAFEIFDQSNAPSYTARALRGGRWYETYNMALMASNEHPTETYKKSRMVIGVEKMPYPRVTRHLETMIGGSIMGHCIGQSEPSLLHHDGHALGCAVCYESIYPEHFARIVAKGAEFMTVITNDAWWGDTPGYKQHLSYSRLRAIETRRSIARSANTGISAFINQRGDVESESEWWQRTSLQGSVSCSNVITPFVRYGDIVGRLCSFVFLLLFLALIVKNLTKKF